VIEMDYIDQIIQGDSLTILKTLPNDIVNMGVTSPPYNKGENKKLASKNSK